MISKAADWPPFRWSNSVLHTTLVVLGLAALGWGWNAPNHYPPWPAFHLEMFAGLGLCLLALAFVVWPTADIAADGARASAVTPPAAMAWFAAGTLPALQWAAGQLPFHGDAVIGALYGAGAGLAVCTGCMASARCGRAAVLRALWLTLLASALLSAFHGWAQWLDITPGGWWAMNLIDNRPFANFGQPNHFGLAMVMGIVAAVALFESGDVQRRAVLAGAVAVLGAGVLMSGSRASVLALFALTAMWLATRHRVVTRLTRFDVVAAIVAGSAMALGMAPLRRSLHLHEAAAARSMTEDGPREAIWRHFIAAIEVHPWVGHGFNQGVAALAGVADQVAPSRNTLYAHNLLLDLATWFGIPAALAMTALLAVWIGGWLRKTGTPEAMSQRHPVAALWLALAVQSMVEFPFAHAYFLLPAALLAGAVTLPSTSMRSPVTGYWKGAGRSLGMRVAASASIALFVLFVVEYLRMESDFRFLRFDRANFVTKERHETPQTPWLLDQLAALNDGGRHPPTTGMSAADLERSHLLARRFHIPSVRLDHAKALALNGRLSDAEHELRIIRSVNASASFAAIDARWRAWLQEHAAEIAGAGPPTR